MCNAFSLAPAPRVPNGGCGRQKGPRELRGRRWGRLRLYPALATLQYTAAAPGLNETLGHALFCLRLCPWRRCSELVPGVSTQTKRSPQPGGAKSEGWLEGAAKLSAGSCHTRAHSSGMSGRDPSTEATTQDSIPSVTRLRAGYGLRACCVLYPATGPPLSRPCLSSLYLLTRQ